MNDDAESLAFSTNQGEWFSFSGYRPLDATSREIRLLLLNTQSTGIQCRLVHASLEAAPLYYTLSYVWGRRLRMQAITIDGETVEIREQVWNFLDSLKHATEHQTLPLWIDVLCINQYDLDERASQVAMMGEIYSKAEATYAWLGPATPSSICAVEFIETETARTDNLYEEYDIDLFREYSEEAHNHFQTVLKPLIDNKYWTRLWIVQEINLSKQIHLLLGRYKISFDDLASVLLDYEVTRRTDLYEEQVVNNASFIGECRFLRLRSSSPRSRQDNRLSIFIQKYRASGCADIRDRVYGMLAMVSDQDRAAIEVSYRSSTLDLYVDVTKTIPSTSWPKQAIHIAEALEVQPEELLIALKSHSTFQRTEPVRIIRLISSFEKVAEQEEYRSRVEIATIQRGTRYNVTGVCTADKTTLRYQVLTTHEPALNDILITTYSRTTLFRPAEPNRFTFLGVGVPIDTTTDPPSSDHQAAMLLIRYDNACISVHFGVEHRMTLVRQCPPSERWIYSAYVRYNGAAMAEVLRNELLISRGFSGRME